jgi:hypothetical protein
MLKPSGGRLQQGGGAKNGEFKSSDSTIIFACQSDGNLVLYNTASTNNFNAIWSSGITSKITNVVFNADGTIAAYSGTNVVWKSSQVVFDNKDNSKVIFTIDSTSLKAIYTPDLSQPNTTLERTIFNISKNAANEPEVPNKADGDGFFYPGIWVKGEMAKGGTGKLIYQTDGNIVYYYNNVPRWASNTSNKESNKLYFFDNGYIALFNDTTIVWVGIYNGVTSQISSFKYSDWQFYMQNNMSQSNRQWNVNNNQISFNSISTIGQSPVETTLFSIDGQNNSVHTNNLH